MTRSARMSSAYDDDFYTWTQDQAVALRHLGDHGDIDAEHLAEEIEDLGTRDLREVTSFLGLLLGHLMKIAMEPAAPSVRHWRIEARAFRRSAAKTFTPGMRRQIDVSAVWREAADSLASDAQDLSAPVPPSCPCPFTLDELLADTFDVDLAIAALSAAFDRANASRHPE